MNVVFLSLMLCAPVKGTSGSFVSVEHHGCGDGMCPQFSLTVHEDGKVEFEGKLFHKDPAKRAKSIARSEVRMFFERFRACGGWSWPQETSHSSNHPENATVVVVEGAKVARVALLLLHQR